MVLVIIDDDGTPAWMVCDAIISKMRDELLSQAVSVMRDQLDRKRISLEGQLPAMSEEGGEKEKDAFLLSQIVKEHENIERRFSEYIDQAHVGKDSLQRIDELQKFLLELRQIVMLNDYSKACESWMADAEKELKEEAPDVLLAKTIKKDTRLRGEILKHVLKDKSIIEGGVFSDDERSIMENALSVSREL
ncbi:MAG: hypothetical protein KGH57_02405 [Candidatus Micrarchaeota archaeon]|nr:hypothetical protein [Candidatus Micrarchaeota archaeon]